MKLKTLALAASATLMAASPAFAAGHAIKVGMITTLSGSAAGLGAEIRDGFQLALDQAGSDAIELIVKDDARKPDVAVSVADEMIQSDKVDIMTGIIWSNLLLAVAPNAVRQGTFYLSPNAGPSALAGKGCHENYFNVSWQNDMLPEASGEYANTAGYKNVFLMAPNYPAGKDMVAGFQRTFKGESAAVVFTKLGQKDYAAEIAQIRASGADAVYYFLPGGMGIAFGKQFAQSGVDTPRFGPVFSFDQTILPAVGDSAIGIHNTTQWSNGLNNAANKKFVEGYQAAYGRLPSFYASQAYDTANLILGALKTAKPADKDAFREALRAANFDSVRGDFSFGNNHHPIHDIYVQKVVKRDDGTLTNEVVAKVVDDMVDSHAANCKM